MRHKNMIARFSHWLSNRDWTMILIVAFYSIFTVLFFIAFSFRYGQSIEYKIAGSFSITRDISAVLLGLMAMPLAWSIYWRLVIIHSLAMAIFTFITLQIYANSLPSANPILDAVWIASYDYLRFLLSLGGLMIVWKHYIRRGKAAETMEK
jgi:hypothetical protein